MAVSSARTFWKGHLRLALVTIPIRLVAAERSDAEIRFHQVDRKSNQRIKYTKTAPGRGEVKKEDIATAYEVEPGNYVFMEDADLDALRLETRHTIELTQFVDFEDIEPLYFERPYYVLPDGDVAAEAYCVIRDALRARKKVALGQLTLRGRENLVALYAGGEGLVLDTLRYASEIKNPDEIFADIGDQQSSADMREMAEDLIDRRSGPFEPEKFKNHYAEALRELVQAKIKTGATQKVDEPEKGGEKVLDFMEALRRSVAAAAPGKADKPAPRPKAAAAKSTAKPAAKKSPPSSPPPAKSPRSTSRKKA